MKTIYSILFIAFLTSTAFSCKSTKSVAEADNSTAEEVVDNGEATSNEIIDDENEIQADGDSLFAHIERGACFGNCPTYKMYIYYDGTVRLTGIRAIDLIGEYETTITKKQMERFTKMADSIDYMSLDDEYDGPITDIPGTMTSIVMDGKKKQVYRRYQYPKRILKFERLFDELLESQSWEKTEDAED